MPGCLAGSSAKGGSSHGKGCFAAGARSAGMAAPEQGVVRVPIVGKTCDRLCRYRSKQSRRSGLPVRRVRRGSRPRTPSPWDGGVGVAAGSEASITPIPAFPHGGGRGWVVVVRPAGQYSSPMTRQNYQRRTTPALFTQNTLMRSCSQKSLRISILLWYSGVSGNATSIR